MAMTCWEVLGVSPAASDQTIKQAFRAKVKLCHPDLCAGDQTANARLKELLRAYEAAMGEAGRTSRRQRLFGASESAASGLGFRPAPDGVFSAQPSAAARIAESVHQASQTLLLLAVLALPFVSVLLAFDAALPSLERMAEAKRNRQPAYGAAQDDGYARYLMYQKMQSDAQASPLSGRMPGAVERKAGQ